MTSRRSAPSSAACAITKRVSTSAPRRSSSARWPRACATRMTSRWRRSTLPSSRAPTTAPRTASRRSALPSSPTRTSGSPKRRSGTRSGARSTSASPRNRRPGLHRRHRSSSPSGRCRRAARSSSRTAETDTSSAPSDHGRAATSRPVPSPPTAEDPDGGCPVFTEVAYGRIGSLRPGLSSRPRSAKDRPRSLLRASRRGCASRSDGRSDNGMLTDAGLPTTVEYDGREPSIGNDAWSSGDVLSGTGGQDLSTGPGPQFAQLLTSQCSAFRVMYAHASGGKGLT